jgi:hypothetical protein
MIIFHDVPRVCLTTVRARCRLLLSEPQTNTFSPSRIPVSVLVFINLVVILESLTLAFTTMTIPNTLGLIFPVKLFWGFRC